jgi:hypothetical protein
VYDKYHDKGFELLSVNVTWDGETLARDFVQQYRLPFPVGRDGNGAIGGVYGVEATPMTFFVDKRGTLVARHDGEFEGNAEVEISRRIEKLLAE